MLLASAPPPSVRECPGSGRPSCRLCGCCTCTFLLQLGPSGSLFWGQVRMWEAAATGDQATSSRHRSSFAMSFAKSACFPRSIINTGPGPAAYSQRTVSTGPSFTFGPLRRVTQKVRGVGQQAERHDVKLSTEATRKPRLRLVTGSSAVGTRWFCSSGCIFMARSRCRSQVAKESRALRAPGAGPRASRQACNLLRSRDSPLTLTSRPGACAGPSHTGQRAVWDAARGPRPIAV